MNWTPITVTRQAVVLYSQLYEQAIQEDDKQSRQFWQSHRDVAFMVVRGTDGPVSDDEIDVFISEWNQGQWDDLPEPEACGSSEQSGEGQ